MPPRVFDAGLCTACRSCELACSYGRLDRFEPSAAGITVTLDRATGSVEVAFNELCDDCSGREQRLCVAFCAPGALSV
jgi:anaerobic carbon-monoxide dehydrogenase iron sulfur subunit